MFYSLKNHRSTQTFGIAEPWDSWSSFPIPDTDSKADFRDWCTKATTEHAFISGVGGRDARLRVTTKKKGSEDHNPVASLHAVIVDYDTRIDDAKLQELLGSGPVDYMPNYILDTFSEGKHRLVWLMPKPIRIHGDALAGEAFKVIKQKLQLDKWLPGFDVQSFTPNQYYEIGRNWTQLNAEPLPESVVYAWLSEAAGKVKLFENGDSKIAVPLEPIAEAVQEQFPSRWDGPFDIGSRGVRFWDPEADNATAAVVTEGGMVCFTGNKSFVSWEEIFGKQFIDEIHGERYRELRENFFYDGQRFWRKCLASSNWVSEGKDDVRRFWHCHGLSRTRVKGRPSEVDWLETEICRDNRVYAALPFLYQKSGLYRDPANNRLYLNICDVKVLPPAAAVDVGDEKSPDFDDFGKRHFPFLHSFFRNLFASPVFSEKDIPDHVPLEDIPLFTFLGWLRRTYVGGHIHNPMSGQALVLAGPVGVGKSFLVEGILANLLGPVSDATSYLVEGGQWTDDACESAIMFVDDTVASSQSSLRKRYTSMIKKAVANTNMNYNKKYGSTGRVKWVGRIIVACNTDPESLKILPDLEQSTLDKISMFLVKPGIELKGMDYQSKKVEEELPLLARFLIDWEVPDWVLGTKRFRGRFGVRPYHHGSLRQAAAATGNTNVVLDILRDLYDDWCEDIDTAAEYKLKIHGEEGEDRKFIWEGRSSKLHRLLAATSPTAGRLAPAQVGQALSSLSSKGFDIKLMGGSKWRIVFDEKLLDLDYDPAANIEKEHGHNEQ